MYFKINKTGMNERKGLLEVRYDCYLSRTDEGNEEHYVTVPVFPPEGYTGEKDEMGRPLDLEAYSAWVASLPTETRNNPFVCHFYQFEPTVTDEELLAKGEAVLAMSIQNWATRELHKNKNDARPFAHKPTYDVVKPFHEGMKEMKGKGKQLNFDGGEHGALGLYVDTNHPEHTLSAVMMTDVYDKLKAIEGRMAELEAAELHLHELAGQYSIRG